MRNLLYAFIAILLIGAVSTGCNSLPFEPTIKQDSTYTILPKSEVELRKAPFRFIISYYSWEMQASDTSVDVYYSFSSDMNELETYQNAVTLDDVGFGKTLSILSPTEESKQSQAQRFKFIREKGRQQCEFTRCREAPEQVHLEFEITHFNGMPVSDMADGKIIYGIQVNTPADKHYYSGLLNFNQ